MNFYEKNLQIIKSKDLYLYKKILSIKVDKDRNKIIETKNGNYTIKVCSDDGIKRIETFLHSKYDPESEAEKFAKIQFENTKKINVIYGFGFGYHIEKILNKLGYDEKLYVVELDLEVFKLALQLRNLDNIFLDKRLELIISDDEKFISQGLKPLLKDENKFLTYVPSIKTIPSRYTYFKFLMEDWNIKKSLTEKWTDLIANNYEQNKNIKCENIGVLFNKYKDKPVVIVSAGPSLNKNKHLLKQLKEKVLIFSVGSALKPLLEVGIKPDMFCIIDPQPITYNQIKGYEDLDIPLVYLDTASAYTVSKYKGPKYVACNDKTHLENKEYVINLGGSVATAVMDMALKFGGNPIVFIGQDLAYTDHQHHADGKMLGGEENVKSLSNMRKVKGQNGEILDTTLGLMSFKYWIENKIKDNQEIEFINATEGGVFIKGCKHMKLQKFIDNYFAKYDRFEEKKNILIEIEETKSGHCTAKIKQKDKDLYIHSKYDSVNEAIKSLKGLENADKNTVFILMGIGLGYNLIELYKRVTPENMIIVVEPNKEMLNHAKKINHIQKIMDEDNIYVVNGFEIDTFKEILNNNIQLENYDNIKIYKLISYERLYPEYFKNIYEAIDIHINQIKLHMDTNKLFGKKMSENVFDNFKYIIKEGNSLEQLKNCFKNKPAIIVSAGPSLEKNISQLKECQNKVVIIAGGRTIIPLLQNGIMPHILCSIDPQDAAFQLVKESKVGSVPLITLVNGNHKVVSDHLGKKVFINDEYYSPIIEYVADRKFDRIKTGGSVATTSLSIADYMGCNPIAFIGQDLAYTNNKFHSDIACENKENNIVRNEGNIKIKDIFENDILTNSALYYYLVWFEEFIEDRQDKIFIDATEGGARIKGTHVDPLKNYIKKYCNEEFLPEKTLDHLLQEKLINKNETKEVLERLKKIYYNLSKMEEYSRKNIYLAKELEKYYVEKTDLSLEEIVSKLDQYDSLIDKYLEENLMMHYFMQPYMMDIVLNYTEKIQETKEEAHIRIVKKEQRIYEMKCDATIKHKEYLMKAIESFQEDI